MEYGKKIFGLDGVRMKVADNTYKHLETSGLKYYYEHIT